MKNIMHVPNWDLCALLWFVGACLTATAWGSRCTTVRSLAFVTVERTIFPWISKCGSIVREEILYSACMQSQEFPEHAVNYVSWNDTVVSSTCRFLQWAWGLERQNADSNRCDCRSLKFWVLFRSDVYHVLCSSDCCVLPWWNRDTCHTPAPEYSW